jgi:cobalt-zinc-cadmium efflux system protein
MSRTVRLWIVLSLNLALVAGLAAVGILSQSIGVFAEGVDYLADAAAVGMALVALRLSKRPGSPSRPDGYPKATAIAALVNGGWLLALSILVAASSV